MKATINSIFLFVIMSLFISCGQQEHSGDVTEIKLDNGKLWQANPETTTGINNMIEYMEAFSDRENVSAYGALQDKLDKEFKLIFKNCTMRGEAHDQLHHFLLPMQKMFKGLGSSDVNVCKANFNSLNNHLAEYGKYFK